MVVDPAGASPSSKVARADGERILRASGWKMTSSGTRRFHDHVAWVTIVPALATWRQSKRRYLYAFAVGIVGYALGLLLSVWLDLPAGAAIVWAMALSGGAILFVKKRP